MMERDQLRDVMREWQSIEPTSQLDERVLDAYRQAFSSTPTWKTVWHRFWRTRVSIPAPVLLIAALLAVAAIVWFPRTCATTGFSG